MMKSMNVKYNFIILWFTYLLRVDIEPHSFYFFLSIVDKFLVIQNWVVFAQNNS